MKIKSCSSNVYSVLLLAVFIIFSFSGCESTTREICRDETVAIESQFTIRNESSSERNIKLYEVHFYSDRWYDDKPQLVSSKTLNSKSETVMQSSMAVNSASGGIMSFMLTVDDRNYAGWKLADAEKHPNMTASVEEYELGYLYLSPPFPAHLQSKLPPQEDIDGTYPNKAFYTVTITDDAVEFVLAKKINQTGINMGSDSD
jgi:hypothetical protein